MKKSTKTSALQRSPTEKVTPKTLLVVDDEAQVRRSLSRILSSMFDDILTAETAAEAEELLDEHTITHLISDHMLKKNGKGPYGAELVPKWRREHSSICRALLITGSDIKMIHAPPEVDKVLSKSVSLEEILEALGFEVGQGS